MFWKYSVLEKLCLNENSQPAKIILTTPCLQTSEPWKPEPWMAVSARRHFLRIRSKTLCVWFPFPFSILHTWGDKHLRRKYLFRVSSLWANSMPGAFRGCILNGNSGEDMVGNTRKGPGSLSQSEAKPLPGTQGPLTRLPRGSVLPISPFPASPALLPPYSSPSTSLSSFLSPYFSPLLFLWKKIRSQNSLHKVFVWSLTWNTLLQSLHLGGRGKARRDSEVLPHKVSQNTHVSFERWC